MPMHTIYFDNAATGFPKAESVLAEMADAFRSAGNAGRSGHELAEKSSEILFSCRASAAKMFGCEPENVILTKNATEALNFAIKGLYKPRSEVLISSMEHNAVYRPAYALVKSGGTLREFSVKVGGDEDEDDAQTLKNAAKLMQRKTSVLALTHASNICGKILPVREIIEEAKKKSIPVVLDASQTVGHIPVSFREYDADFICFPGHKGLYGPMGTGLLLCNPIRRHRLKTIIEGGTGVSSAVPDMPLVLPERFEAGTSNIYGFAGLKQAIDEFAFYTDSEMKIFTFLLDSLRRREDITLYGAPSGTAKRYVPIILFNKRHTDSESLTASLAEHGFAVRGGLQCAPLAHKTLGTLKSGAVRISIGRHNTMEEAEKLASLL